MDPRFKHPFGCILAGPTGCGKTSFIERFIENISELMTPCPNEIIICYTEWQPAYERLQQKRIVS